MAASGLRYNRPANRYATVRNPNRRRPDRLTLLIAAIAALGVALTLAREVTYGAGCMKIP